MIMSVHLNRSIHVISKTKLELKSIYSFIKSLGGPISSFKDSLVEWDKKGVAMEVKITGELTDYSMPREVFYRTKKAADSIKEIAELIFYEDFVVRVENKKYIVEKKGEKECVI